MAARKSKYSAERLIKLLRFAAAFRSKCHSEGPEDNMGAIHSAERALHLLGPILVHPGMGHLNNLKKYPDATFSVKALAAHQAGEKVTIEHVQPHRALTCRVIEEIERDANDEDLLDFIRANFQIVLLTPEEAKHLNKINRSKIDPDRLRNAGITLVERNAKVGEIPGVAHLSL